MYRAKFHAVLIYSLISGAYPSIQVAYQFIILSLFAVFVNGRQIQEQQKLKSGDSSLLNLYYIVDLL